MAISDQLTLLNNTKTAIRTAINNKGGSVTDSTPFADYSTAIDNLPSGGETGNPLLKSIDVSDYTSGNNFNYTNLAQYITGFTLPKTYISYTSPMARDAQNLVKIEVEEGNPNYDSRDNCNAIISTNDNMLYFGCKTTVIPNSVVAISSFAFYNCDGLTNINIPDSVTNMGQGAFQGCSNLTSVTMPSHLTAIDLSLFGYCSSLTSITIPDSVATIGERAFQSCTSLTSITIPSSVTSIGGSAFANCTSLTSITIPSSITNIENSTFNGCSSLTSITIPDGVTRIGNSAFSSCKALTSATCLATTPPSLGYYAFNDTNNCPIYVPASSLESYKTASNWSTYADRIQAIPEDVKPAFKFTSSVDSSKDITVNCEDTATAGTLTMNDLGMSSQQIDEFRSAENTGSVEIGDCVKIYRASNCYTAKGISEVKLNEGLERIEDFAFGGMSALREITIPSTVTNISYQAFYADRALQGITCLATTPPTLGSDVFGDTNNCPIYVPGDSLDAYKSAWSQYADRIEPI